MKIAREIFHTHNPNNTDKGQLERISVFLGCRLNRKR